eukprot:scaffold6940_cov42-Phaeocystis_antarctica.AAC.2
MCVAYNSTCIACNPMGATCDVMRPRARTRWWRRCGRAWRRWWATQRRRSSRCRLSDDCTNPNLNLTLALTLPLTLTPTPNAAAGRAVHSGHGRSARPALQASP